MRTIERNIVSALIFSKDNKIFLGKKQEDKGGVYAGCWHFPGGGIEDSEQPIDALKREVFEETGIDISKYPIALADDKGIGESPKTLPDGEKVLCKMQFAVYKVNLDRSAADIVIKLNDDLDSFEWVGIDELKQFKLTLPSVSSLSRLKIF